MMNLENVHVVEVKILNPEKHLTGILMETLKRRRKCLERAVEKMKIV